MTSDAFAKFQKSIRDYGWYQYREGDGYDLEALRNITPSEAEQVIDQMEASTSPDWVAVEVLETIGTERCIKTLEKWTRTQGVICRMSSLSALHKRKMVDDINAEEIILKALSEATIINGMTRVLAWAKKVPTTKIKKKVLWCALHGHEDIRAHCAALAHYLYGVTKEEFEMNKRSFYFQFNDIKTVKSAYHQLCIDVGDVGSD